MANGVKHAFKCTNINSQYLFKNGKAAPFIGGWYYTDVQSEIDELSAEIASGHPFFSIDENRKTVTAEEMDPLDSIKKKAVAEYLAAQAAAINKSRNMGQTEGGSLKGIANSNTINEGMAGSDSSATSPAGGTEIGARLANLTVKK